VQEEILKKQKDKMENMIEEFNERDKVSETACSILETC
jgi:hypothetical protein